MDRCSLTLLADLVLIRRVGRTAADVGVVSCTPMETHGGYWCSNCCYGFEAAIRHHEGGPQRVSGGLGSDSASNDRFQ
jgi:hypothetical protein